MSKFNEYFKDFSSTDYYGYAGAMNLINGGKPKIHHLDTKDDDLDVDIILSGDGAGSTIISVVYSSVDKSVEYNISLPGYNKCHQDVAESIVDYFKDYEIVSEAIIDLIEDYGMTIC